MKKEVKNNKNSKIQLILLIAIVLVISIIIVVLLINKKDDTENKGIPKTISNIKDIFTNNNYSLKGYIVSSDETVNKKNVTLAKSNNMICLATTNYRIIIKGEYIYAISPTDKTMLQYNIDENNKLDIAFTGLLNNKITNSGTKTIEEKEYKFDDYNGVIVYKKDNIVEYIEVTGLLLKINEIYETPEDSLFEIPKDYKVYTKDDINKEK